MKQEFITSNGKVIIERDKIYIQNLRRNITNKAISGWIFFIAIIFAALVPAFSQWYMVVFFGIFALVDNFQFIKQLPTLSFKNRILISEIEKVSFNDDPEGFDTIVNLHLVSGKCRRIKFRKLEHQYDSFLEAVSHQKQEVNISI
jgi:hypothetical protein